jgi:hypothetical protein
LPIDFDFSSNQLMVGSAHGVRLTCESCKSIDLRRWHREGRLSAGQEFSWSWGRGGELSSGIRVRARLDEVVLTHRYRGWGAAEWKTVEQRVPITWTGCHFGGHRPWFVCGYCACKFAVLYGVGAFFACRRCHGLVYASQRNNRWHRGVSRAQKIRMRLGGSPSLFDPVPEKPKGMHWRTYLRLRQEAQTLGDRSIALTMQKLDRWHRFRHSHGT